jgi:soluble lytic murein transglycosylase-like protein
MSINALRSLGDDQLKMVAEKVKRGDTSDLQALGMYSAAPVLMELMNRNKIRQAMQAQQAQQAKQPTIADEATGVGALPVPGVMEEQNFAGGGIVAFEKGGQANYEYSNPYGVPEDILRAVHGAESSFGTRNVSPAGAKGHFQFMKGTGKEYGLTNEADFYDFAKSKNSAAKYLSRLHNQFGNWEDALSAYNWGPGHMEAFKKTGKGMGGLARPPESINYPAAIQKYLGPNATILNRRGIQRAGLDERFPVESAQAPKDDGLDHDSRLKKASEDYKAQIKANEDFYGKEMADIKRPENPDQEGIRTAYMERMKKFSDPMLQEMRDLIAKQAPNTEAAKSQAFNNALMTAGLTMMGTPGGLGAAIGRGGLAGLGAYQRDIGEAQAAEHKFLNAQIKSKQYEFGLAKETVESAEDAVKNAVREYGIDSRVAQKAMEDLRQARFNANKLALQERALVEKGLIQEKVDEARYRRTQEGIASRERIAAGREASRRTEAENRAERKDETALERAYTAALKDDEGYRDYVRKQKAAGYKDQIKTKEEWAREVAPTMVYKNPPSTQEKAPAEPPANRNRVKLFE